MVSREKKSPEYKSAATLSTVLQVMLFLNIGASLIKVVADLLSSLCLFTNLSHARYGSEEANCIHWLQLLSDLPGTVLFYATGLIFVCWLLRIRKNVLTLGAEQLRSRDYECWLGFNLQVCTPLLYLPPRTMQELWKASTPETLDPLAWKKTAESQIIKLWWTFWLYWLLCEGIVSTWHKILEAKDEPLSNFFWVYQLSVFSEIFCVAAAICAILLVRDLTNRQIARHKMMEIEKEARITE